MCGIVCVSSDITISIELKKSYFDTNCKNHRNAVELKTQAQFIFEDIESPVKK